MQASIKNFIHNFFYSLSSNITGLAISLLITLVLPRFLGLTEYSYWQLYIFYSNYIGFFHLGWNDGIYLRYGGRKYSSLDRDVFFSQFLSQMFLQMIFAIVIIGIGKHVISEPLKGDVVFSISFCLVLTNIRYFFLYILQATNRIKEYALVTIIDRVIFLFLVCGLFLLRNVRFQPIIFADLTGRLLSLLLVMYYCRDLILHCKFKLSGTFSEIYENISAGIKLLFSNIASNLIIGIVRFGIEYKWSIETFGRVSLMISISNFAVTFVNAVGVVVYPVLRNIDDKRSKEIFYNLNHLLTTIFFVFLFFYYPFKHFLVSWLPDYADSVRYIAVLLPICVYEGKMALLYNTYLKAYRKEKQMLLINCFSLFLSGCFTFIFVMLLKNLELAILSILLLIMVRSLLCEVYLSGYLSVGAGIDICIEMILTAAFVMSNYFLEQWQSIILYCIVYLLHIFIRYHFLKNCYKNLKVLLSL